MEFLRNQKDSILVISWTTSEKRVESDASEIQYKAKSMNVIYPKVKHNGKSSCVHLKEDRLSVIELSIHIFKVYITT